MFARLRAALSYGNVVGTLALFIALGGVSYAAVKLPARSVGTKQLKTGAVTSAKVRNGTLHKDDFADGEAPRGKTGPAGADGVDGLPGANGAAGPKGERGPEGPKGDAGHAASDGQDGAPGPPGPPGADGDDGVDGTDGTNGTNGTAGPPGPPGATGATGPAGPAGSAGAIGPLGPKGTSGAQGSSGVVGTWKISGAIGPIAAADGVWQFLGPQAPMGTAPALQTTNATQRMTASLMVPLATTGSPQTIKLDVCYQASAGGPIAAFSGGAFSLVAVTQTRVAQAVSGSVQPGAGTWKVGACAQTAAALDNNDFVNGYVQVTN
jgi:hypothetical protein